MKKNNGFSRAHYITGEACTLSYLLPANSSSVMSSASATFLSVSTFGDPSIHPLMVALPRPDICSSFAIEMPRFSHSSLMRS